jgi:hypothetical protein
LINLNLFLRSNDKFSFIKSHASIKSETKSIIGSNKKINSPQKISKFKFIEDENVEMGNASFYLYSI